MTVIVLLLIISLLIATGFLIAFLWSVKSGQLEDGKASALRMLFEDKPTLSEDK